MSESLGSGPDTAFVNPYCTRESALPTIGNKRGLIENKKVPATLKSPSWEKPSAKNSPRISPDQ